MIYLCFLSGEKDHIQIFQLLALYEKIEFL